MEETLRVRRTAERHRRSRSNDTHLYIHAYAQLLSRSYDTNNFTKFTNILFVKPKRGNGSPANSSANNIPEHAAEVTQRARALY